MLDLSENLAQAIGQKDLTACNQLLMNFDSSSSSLSNDSLLDKILKFELLQSAIFKKHLGIVKLLLSKGFNVAYEDDSGFSKNTLLHDAVKTGNAAIVRQLLDHKADPCAMAKDGKTPLFRAVEMGATNIIKVILSAISCNNGNNTRLQSSIDQKNRIVAKNKQQFYLHTLFHETIKNGNVKILEALMKHQNISTDFGKITSSLIDKIPRVRIL